MTEEQPIDAEPIPLSEDFAKQVAISTAVARFMRADKAHADAEIESDAAYRAMESLLNLNDRVVVKVDYQYHLVEIDDDGIYVIHPIEVV